MVGIEIIAVICMQRKARNASFLEREETGGYSVVTFLGGQTPTDTTF